LQNSRIWMKTAKFCCSQLCISAYFKITENRTSLDWILLYKYFKTRVSKYCVKAADASIDALRVMLHQRHLKEGRQCHEHYKLWIGCVAFLSIFQFHLILSYGSLVKSSFIEFQTHFQKGFKIVNTQGVSVIFLFSAKFMLVTFWSKARFEVTPYLKTDF